MKQFLIILLVFVLTAGIVGTMGVLTDGFKDWKLSTNAKTNATNWADSAKAHIEELKNKDKTSEEEGAENEGTDEENGTENGGENGSENGGENGSENGGENGNNSENTGETSSPSSLAEVTPTLTGINSGDYISSVIVNTGVDTALLDAYLADKGNTELLAGDDFFVGTQAGGLVVGVGNKALVYAPDQATVEGVTFSKGWTLLTNLEEMTKGTFEGTSYEFQLSLPARVYTVDPAFSALNGRVVGCAAQNELTEYFTVSTTLPLVGNDSYIDGIIIKPDAASNDVLAAITSTFDAEQILLGVQDNEYSVISYSTPILGVVDERSMRSVQWTPSGYDFMDGEDVVFSLPAGWSLLIATMVDEEMQYDVSAINGDFTLKFAEPVRVVCCSGFELLNGRVFGAYEESPCMHVFVDGTCARCGTYEVCFNDVHEADSNGYCIHCGVHVNHVDDESWGMCSATGYTGFHVDSDEDNRCDNCGRYLNPNQNEPDGLCDYCGVEMSHFDADGDNVCDYCCDELESASGDGEDLTEDPEE